MKSHLALVPRYPPGPQLLPLTRAMWDAFSSAQQPEHVIQLALTARRSFAVVEGDFLAVIYGIFPAHEGRWQGWMLSNPSVRARQLVFATHQACALFDRWQSEDPSCRRIEIQIRADQPWRESFARRLGMTECLGPARAFFPDGTDAWFYARVRP